MFCVLFLSISNSSFQLWKSDIMTYGLTKSLRVSSFQVMTLHSFPQVPPPAISLILQAFPQERHNDLIRDQNTIKLEFSNFLTSESFYIPKPPNFVYMDCNLLIFTILEIRTRNFIKKNKVHYILTQITYL